MIFHLEEEKYRDYASAFQFSRPIEGQENLKVKTQGNVYIVNEICKLFMISDEVIRAACFCVLKLGNKWQISDAYYYSNICRYSC